LVAYKGGFEPLEISVEPTYTKKKKRNKRRSKCGQ